MPSTLFDLPCELRNGLNEFTLVRAAIDIATKYVLATHTDSSESRRSIQSEHPLSAHVSLIDDTLNRLYLHVFRALVRVGKTIMVTGKTSFNLFMPTLSASPITVLAFSKIDRFSHFSVPTLVLHHRLRETDVTYHDDEHGRSLLRDPRERICQNIEPSIIGSRIQSTSFRDRHEADTKRELGSVIDSAALSSHQKVRQLVIQSHPHSNASLLAHFTDLGSVQKPPYARTFPLSTILDNLASTQQDRTQTKNPTPTILYTTTNVGRSPFVEHSKHHHTLIQHHANQRRPSLSRRLQFHNILLPMRRA